MRSIRHHYIPIFYTKRWTADGILCEYSTPYGRKVKPLRKAPSATGYRDRLYEMKGFPEALAQQIEERFFSPADAAAADALTYMETTGNPVPNTPRLRSGWTRFMTSLMFRMPEDIDILYASLAREFRTSDPRNEKAYADALALLARNTDIDKPETFADYLAGLSDGDESYFVFKVIRSMVDNERIGNTINSMIWRVIAIKDDARTDLLTSDRPLIKTPNLSRNDSYLAIAIGPRKLFLAARSRRFLDKMSAKEGRQLVVAHNRAIVGAAVKFVYGRNADDEALEYIQRHMGTLRKEGIAEKLARRSEGHRPAWMI